MAQSVGQLAAVHTRRALTFDHVRSTRGGPSPLARSALIGRRGNRPTCPLPSVVLVATGGFSQVTDLPSVGRAGRERFILDRLYLPVPSRPAPSRSVLSPLEVCMGRLQPWLAELYCQWGGVAVKMASFMAMAVAMAVENEKLCRENQF